MYKIPHLFLRIGPLTKFISFVLFTVIYTYFAFNSMPPRNRTTSSKNRNITSKIISRIEEETVDLYAVEEEMAYRREQMYATCQNPDSHATTNTLNFVVDAHHSLVWCKIFKSASSTWINYFNLLGGYDESYLKRKKLKPSQLLRSIYPNPTLSQLGVSLHSSLSFLIVRDPLERLHSIYKFVLTNHKLRNKIKKGLITKSRPTFKEFIEYVVQHEEELWTPMYRICSPCAINFTVIAKFESLQEDQEYIIKRAGVDDVLAPSKVKLQYVAHRGKSKESENYYSEIDNDLLTDLIRIYKIDYEMFGYNMSKYVSLYEK